MLIDAGNREDTNLVTEFIKNAGIERLDYVVATHPHEDHIGGMCGVIESFEIGKLYMPDAINTTIYLIKQGWTNEGCNHWNKRARIYRTYSGGDACHLRGEMPWPEESVTRSHRATRDRFYNVPTSRAAELC